MDFIKGPERRDGPLSLKDSLSMFGNIPVQVSFMRLVAQHLFRQGGFSNLAHNGNEDHFPLQVFFDLRRQIAFHGRERTAIFDPSQKNSRVFLTEGKNASPGINCEFLSWGPDLSAGKWESLSPAAMVVEKPEAQARQSGTSG